MSQSLFDTDVSLNDTIVSSDRSNTDSSPSASVMDENLESSKDGCCQEDTQQNLTGEQQDRVGRSTGQSSANEGSRTANLPFSNQIPFTKQEQPEGML